MADLELSLSTTTGKVRPSDSIEIKLRVRNLDSVVNSYNLDFLGIDSGWVFVDRGLQLNLLDRQSAELGIVFQPPLENSRAGLYKVGITVSQATPAGQPALKKTATFDLEVLPVPDFSIEMTPRYLHAQRGG